MKMNLFILLIMGAFHLEAQNKNCKIHIEYVDIGTHYQISYPQSYPNIDDIKNDSFKRDTCISKQSLLRELVKLTKSMENNMIPCQGDNFLDCRLKDGRIVITIEGEKTNSSPIFIGKSGTVLYKGKLYEPDKRMVVFLQKCFSDVSMTRVMCGRVGLPHPWDN